MSELLLILIVESTVLWFKFQLNILPTQCDFHFKLLLSYRLSCCVSNNTNAAGINSGCMDNIGINKLSVCDFECSEFIYF